MIDTNDLPEPREGTVVSGDRINFGAHGIKCDACEYSDMSVPYEDYPMYIGKPCPVCCAPLLTEEQLRETNAAIQAAQQLNAMGEDELRLIEKQLEGMSIGEKDAILQTLPDWMKAAMPEL